MYHGELIVPLRNLKTEQLPWEGFLAKKPWDYQVTAVIPVLDTADTLEMVIELLQLQTVRPYILVVDTGSMPEQFAKIEAMRSENVEVHALRMHGTPHPSDFPAVAMDLAFSLCRTQFLFATHADCFLRRRDFLEYEMGLCGEEHPVVGYEISPRQHPDWQGMFGHTVTMFHMPTMDQIGGYWSLRRLCVQFGIPWSPNANGPGWPDTELLLNYQMRQRGLKPLLIGHDVNYERQVDDNIDHVRSLTGSMLYSPEHYARALVSKAQALAEARKRCEEWRLMVKRVKRLACVVVYDRADTIEKWLRAWNNAEHYDTELAVIHNYDGPAPDRAMMETILKHKPDYYIRRRNVGWDVGALKDVFENRLNLPAWDHLFWFTDDMLPMRRTFLKPFVEKIQEPGVGLVAQCYEPKSPSNPTPHVRTVAFALTRQAADKLYFPLKPDGEVSRIDFEAKPGENLLAQVVRQGLQWKVCHGGDPNSSSYVHWTSYCDWMWDCSLLGGWADYWGVYQSQFEEIQRREDLKGHPYMLLPLAECEQLTTLEGKATAVIATCQAPLEALAWAVFSLLARSEPHGVLDHIIVHINGPDSRTGNPDLQDRKQAFLEEIRQLKWGDRHMPLTVQRTWSRVGHAHALEGSIPWVHTEAYLLMHDDVVLLSNSWEEAAKAFFQDKQVAFQSVPPIAISPWQGDVEYPDTVRMPHLNTTFTLCRKGVLAELGARWTGYHVPLDYQIGNLANYSQFRDFHARNGNIVDPSRFPEKEATYKHLSMDIGAWLYHRLQVSGYRTREFSPDVIHHFLSGSWLNAGSIGGQNVPDCVGSLEKKLAADFPEFHKVYKKYVRCD